MNKVFVLKIITISFLFGIFFILISDHPLINDATIYDILGLNLARGNGFSLTPIAFSFTPTSYRAPAYPFFLAGIYKVFGHSYTLVYLLQTLLFSLTCLFVYFSARNIFDEKIARYSALFTALCPTLANYSTYILTETLFTFLLCFEAWILTKILIQKKD